MGDGDKLLTMMDFDAYRALPGVNASTLKALDPPLRARWQAEHESSSTSMTVGRATHTAILETALYASQYVVYDGTRRGKAWDEFREANAGREILTASEHETVWTIAQATLRHPDVPDLLRHGVAEGVIQWQDKASGADCKARVDWYDVKSARLVDLKTARDVSPRGFAKAMIHFNYDLQLAFYADGLRALDLEVCDVYVIAAQNCAPWDVAVYEIGPDWYERGRQLYRERLEIYQSCLDRDYWPGCCPRAMELEVPEWALSTASMLTLDGEAL